MPFTKGDAKQFALGLLAAVLTAVFFNLGDLTGVPLRNVDWATFGWDLLDNAFQSLITYLGTWWAITKTGIVRVQREVPAYKVEPQTEKVIEQIPPSETGGT